jgi:hypothetical protein
MTSREVEAIESSGPERTAQALLSLRCAVDHCNDAVFITDASGKIEFQLFPGTQAGNFTVTVRGKDAPKGERPQTGTLRLVTAPGGSLAGQMHAALYGDVPNPPIPANNPSTDAYSAHSENINWLGAAFAKGRLHGWSFLPVYLANPRKYGLIFYKLGSAPAVDPDGTVHSGKVYDEGGTYQSGPDAGRGRGLKPIADSGEAALQSFGGWSGGNPVVVYGVTGLALSYQGWPFETGGAYNCLAAGG